MMYNAVEEESEAVAVDQAEKTFPRSNDEDPEPDDISREIRNVEDAEKIEPNKDFRAQFQLDIRE